jgi:hypothetical protein
MMQIKGGEQQAKNELVNCKKYLEHAFQYSANVGGHTLLVLYPKLFLSYAK